MSRTTDFAIDAMNADKGRIFVDEPCAVCHDEPRIQLIEGNFSRVRLRTQDVIVIQTEKVLSGADKVDVLQALRSIFPGNRALILDNGIKIGSLAPLRDEDCEDDDDG